MAGKGRLTGLGASIRERVGSRLPAGPVVVALSGGADSAVCLWSIRELGRPVRAVFVHHGFPESDSLQRAAEKVAAGLDVPLGIVAVAVGEEGSPEAAARSVRYRALEAECEEEEWLATGHTADDVAETVLANLLRGAGATGLSGIPGRRGRIVRPLLDVWRAETRELEGLLGLLAIDDPSNFAPSPLRNRIRHRLIPQLEAEYNSDLRGVLLRSAAAAGADETALDALAAEVPVRRLSDRVRLPAGPLLTSEPAVAVRVIRRGLRLLHPPYAGTQRDVAAVAAVAAGAPATQIGGGVRAERTGPFVDLVVADERSGEKPLMLPGVTEHSGLTIEAHVERVPPFPWPLGSATAVVDADALGSDAIVRPLRPGDEIHAGGRMQEVREVLRAAGIPPALRAGWPVVAARGKLGWIVAIRPADWLRPGAGTARWLWMHARMEAW